MFRLKNLNILGSKAELAALPEGKLLINTINAHSYNTARKDELFAEALTNGDVLIPDGVSIVKACRWIKAKSLPKERIAGWDLFEFEMNKLEECGMKNVECGVNGEECGMNNSSLDNSSSASADHSCSGKRLYEPSAKLKIQNSKFLIGEADNSKFKTQNSKFLKAAHRLDMDTSGLLVLARTEEAYVELQRQFASRETVKRYEAVLSGVPTQNSKLKTQNSSAQPSGCVEAISLPLIADINDRPRQRVDMEHGKPALTLYNIVEVRAVDANTAVAYTTKKVDKGRTLVHLYPKTGRTHQLRVHCAHPLGLACPILGDPLYGIERADRMYLHAAELTFHHPVTGETMHFLSPSGF